METEVKEVKVKEKKKLNVKQKLLLIAGTGALVLTGFKLGHSFAAYEVNKGLEVVFETDPTLKEHLVNAMGDTYKRKLLKK